MTSPDYIGLPSTAPVRALPWADRALCATDADPEMWFEAATDRYTADQGRAMAIEICARCPVVDPCAAYALADPSLDGIWGGMTAQDRRRIRRWKP